MKKIITIISVFADTLQRIFSVATDVFSIIATVALMLIRTGLSVFAVQVLFDFVHKAQMGASGYVVASIATVVIIVKYVQAFIRAKHAIFGDAPVLPKVQPNSPNSEDPLVSEFRNRSSATSPVKRQRKTLLVLSVSARRWRTITTNL